MPDHRQTGPKDRHTRRSLVVAAVDVQWVHQPPHSLPARTTPLTIAKQASSCLKGLLPAVTGITHLSRPATAQLTRALEVDVAFLKALATIDDDVVLLPDQIDPATRIAGWATEIALAVYRVRTRRRREALTFFVSRRGLFANDNCRKIADDHWLTAVRIAALNLIADGRVEITSLTALESRLAEIDIATLWGDRVHISLPSAPSGSGSSATESDGSTVSVKPPVSSVPRPTVAGHPVFTTYEDAAKSLVSDSRWKAVAIRSGVWQLVLVEEVLARCAEKLIVKHVRGEMPAELNNAFLSRMVKWETQDLLREMMRATPKPPEDLDQLVENSRNLNKPNTSGDVSGGSAADDTEAESGVDNDPQAAKATERQFALDLYADLLRTGEAQGVRDSILAAHAFVAEKIATRKPRSLWRAIRGWYFRYYHTTLKRPVDIATTRAGERLREVRYAAAHREFPPDDDRW